MAFRMIRSMHSSSNCCASRWTWSAAVFSAFPGSEGQQGADTEDRIQAGAAFAAKAVASGLYVDAGRRVGPAGARSGAWRHYRLICCCLPDQAHGASSPAIATTDNPAAT